MYCIIAVGIVIIIILDFCFHKDKATFKLIYMLMVYILIYILIYTFNIKTAPFIYRFTY